MAAGLNLDPWWDEPGYKEASVTFRLRGLFIFDKLKQHDAARFAEVMADLHLVEYANLVASLRDSYFVPLERMQKASGDFAEFGGRSSRNSRRRRSCLQTESVCSTPWNSGR